MMHINAIRNMDKKNMSKRARGGMFMASVFASTYYLIRFVALGALNSSKQYSDIDGVFMLLIMCTCTLYSLLKPHPMWPEVKNIVVVSLKGLIIVLFLKAVFSITSYDANRPDGRSLLVQELFLNLMLIMSLIQVFLLAFGVRRLLRL